VQKLKNFALVVLNQVQRNDFIFLLKNLALGMAEQGFFILCAF
jgi:hypothetical protein